MKTIATITAVMALFAAPAFAQDGGYKAEAGGTLKGSTSSLSVTGGLATGTGAMAAEASNFSASQGTLGASLSPSTSGLGGTLTVTSTSETFTQGAASSWTSGSGIGGAGQLGGGLAGSDHWGDGKGWASN